MVLPGFILGKINYFKEDFYTGLSRFALDICVPALILHSLQIDFSHELILGLGKTFAYWIPVLIAGGILSVILTRALHFTRAQMSLIFCMLGCSNTGFVGIPLCLQLYGEESLFFASACEIAGDVFLYSVIFTTIAFASGYKAELNFKTLFVNPPMIAMAIGLVLFFLQIRLPSFISTPIGYFSGCCAPVSLFILGAQLSKLTIRDFLGDPRMYVICAARLIILPLIAFLLVRVCFHDSSLFSRVFIIMIGMPAAAVTTTAAVNYGSDKEFAAKGVSLSTALCLFTAPIWAMIL